MTRPAKVVKAKQALKANPKTTSKTSDGIVLIRPLLILFVVLVHLPFFDTAALQYGAGQAGFASVVEVFLKDTFSKGAMPFLSLLSGYLAIKSYQRDGYTKNLRTKVKRLLIPMFWANLFLIIFFLYPVQSDNPSYRAELSIAPFNLWGWLQALFGIYRLPANPPLYFLKDLFVCFMVLPLLLLTLRYKLLSAAVWLWMAYKTLMVQPVFLIPYFPFVFFRFDIIFAFYTGLLCYHWHSKLLFSNRQFCIRVIAVYSVFCLLSAVLMVKLSATDYSFLFLLIKFLVKLLGVFTAVTMMSLLVTAKSTVVKGFSRFLKVISKYTFMIFLTHIYTLIALEQIYMRYFSLPSFADYTGWLFLVILLTSCIAVAAIVYELLERLKPKLNLIMRQLNQTLKPFNLGGG